MNIPRLDNPDLSYETGVHLGDGNLWRNRYVISGNKKNETEYYRNVLLPLINDLYCLSPKILFQDNTVYLRVYSKELVEFKHQVLGLPIGRKVGLRLPSFGVPRRQNVAEVVSGLYDTDGSVKVRHNESGDYPRISFAQKHLQLVIDTMNFLKSIGITSTMYRNDYHDPRSGKTTTRWFLDVNGYRNFELFKRKIGTRSPYVARRMDAVDSIG